MEKTLNIFNREDVQKITNIFIDEYNASTDTRRRKDLDEQIKKNIKFIKTGKYY